MARARAGRGGAGRAREVLGLGPGAGAREAAAAYRALMRRLHPDVAGGGSTEEAARVNAAYEEFLAEVGRGRGAAGARGGQGARGAGRAPPAEEPSWSGASLAAGDPGELWCSPWDGEEYWVTEGQARELDEYARRGWAREAAAMVREFRWRNDRWRP